jgi:hypothetical protein
MLVLAAGAIAGEHCGKHGTGHHGKKVLLGTQIEVVNTQDGAQMTVTALDAEKAEAVKAHFAHMLDRKARGLGCPFGNEGCQCGPECKCGPDCKCGDGKGECKCGPDCKCGDGKGECKCGKGECKCGPDCKCGDGKGECKCGPDCKCGKGECKCGKGEGVCGCGGAGGCKCGHGDRPKLCSLLSADDVAFAVEEFELGVVVSVTTATPEKVVAVQDTLAKLAEFVNNWKPGEGCGCQGK